ncbi:aminoglycoside 6-adenylyltransferase [Bacillus aquiflavi]|uniref:Aminoglycoside 6-adenylyltransferase n=1 Tax=Bacillus aquiflavi TaxID=2672567 RepID=A0A6B3W3E7_9BACI|nr:aminoglycoside 6-adenylyltransferase [Bacillus aquiflavi]MBA4538143.1 aminoglycoside 6-adenylyltransferase [Bacillus aquiflavi]NEY82463.1 aminoglycoside 6-adenylyltransferase [Bacillus aquiflavi]UAC48565.1 aminoglycoside 6-adenylyltransferase [Bacillus aquiflavi]
MRSEQEIIDLILSVAKKDKRIRAVWMSGSRTNPNVPQDPFRDYDLVYLVTDMQSFIDDPNWIDVFGERIMMQTPETSVLYPPELDGRFPYLMLFTDGNRIDLTLICLEEGKKYCQEDKLTVIILDKDDILPSIPSPTDKDYWVKTPSAHLFSDCCNEFWWVSTYVAKGLWRQEMIYAYDHLNIVRSMLIKMLEWRIGIERNFSLSIGKNGKYLKRYLNKETWESLLSTYPNGDEAHVWNALFLMTEVFEQVAVEVAEELQFNYPLEEWRKVKQYLHHVRTLPLNVTAMYE